MALRESTIPQICNRLRQDPGLPSQLRTLVQGMISKAKDDLDDFYSEVTFRSQRKKDSGFKRKDRKIKKEDKGIEIKKRKLEDEDSEPEDDEEEDGKEEDQEQEDEKQEEDEDSSDGEESEAFSKNKQNEDNDIFSGRFATPPPATPKSGTGGGAGADGQFKKSLREMINQAMACGALPADPRLTQTPNKTFHQ